MNLYELEKKLKISQEKGFKFNEVVKLTKKNLFKSIKKKYKLLFDQ